MKQRLGAFLCLALGAVLITTGLNSGSGGAVGDQVPDCGAATVGVTVPCPTGTIEITESTMQLSSGFVQHVVGRFALVPTPPAGGWVVDITSTCLDPSTTNPVATSVTIPDGGTGTSDPLFVFTNSLHTASCSYTLAEHPVTGFTAAFVPASPVTITFGGGQTNSGRKVDLTNTFAVAPTSTAAPSSAAPSSAAPSSAAPVTESASAAPVVAVTGPHEQVRATIYIGIGLCLLGLMLLFGGNLRLRRARHGA